jgi:hypothetical protein
MPASRPFSFDEIKRIGEAISPGIQLAVGKDFRDDLKAQTVEIGKLISTSIASHDTNMMGRLADHETADTRQFEEVKVELGAQRVRLSSIERRMSYYAGIAAILMFVAGISVELIKWAFEAAKK